MYRVRTIVSKKIFLRDYALFYSLSFLFTLLVGEIVEWWGFAIACNTFTASSFAFYTTAYLTTRAVHVSDII